MRTVLSVPPRAMSQALLALDVYVHRLRAAIAAMTASLGGLDALVFTGRCRGALGADPGARRQGMAFLGIGLDDRANDAAGATTDVEIGGSGASVRAFVVPAREDVEIARQVREAVGG